MIGKLKNDRENLINSLCDNIAALERIAFEQQAEIERLNTSYEVVKKEYDSMFTANRNLMAEIEVLKKIQQKILSKQGDYTTNNTTVCEDCEKLWINALLKTKSEAIKEITDGLVTMFLNINESLNCEDIVENIKRFSSRLTEGRENG